MEIATNSPYWPYGPRTAAQIRATKELHEPRHVEDARRQHDKYQNKIGAAIDRVRGNETPQRALDRVREKLQKEFERTVKPDETTGRWKQIRQMEGAQFSNFNFGQTMPSNPPDAAEIENQQGAIPDFGMLGGGGLGFLGGPPRTSTR
jgi:SOS response regulatory protein OraA/RecX